MPPVAADFEKVTLDDDTKAPMEIDIADDGRVFYIELDGRVRGGQADQASGEPGLDPARIPVVTTSIHENGLLGIQLAPDFDDDRPHLPVVLDAAGPAGPVRMNRISRFTINADNQIARPEQVDLHVDPPARGVLPHRRLARLRPRRQPLPLDGRQHEPVRATATTRRTSGRAARTGTPSARRPTRTARTARSCASCRSRERRSARPAWGRRTHPRGQHVPGRHRPDAARDLRDGLPQPVPDPRRPGDGRHASWATTARTPARRARTAARRARSSSTSSRSRASTAGPTASARTSPTTTSPTRATRARAPTTGSTTAPRRSTTRPTTPGLTNLPAAKPGHDVDGLQRARHALPRPRRRRRADRRHRATTSTRTARRRPSSRGSTTASGSSASGTTTGSRPPRWNDDGLATGVSCFAICTGYISPMDIEFGPDGSHVRRRVGPGLRREQRRLGHLPGRLRPGRAAADRAGHRRRRTAAPCRWP